MALSDFQKKKVVNVFEKLYDSNKDGVIDKNDFSDAMQKISELHHWGTNDDKYNKAKKELDAIWDGLKKAADTNKDDKVTQDEWLKMWTTMLGDVKNGKPFPEWQQNYMNFMFEANDTSGDGLIDCEEFVSIQNKIFGNEDEASSTQVFNKLVEGKKEPTISKEDFENMWHEYFLSTDESNKGNFLFGQL